MKKIATGLATLGLVLSANAQTLPNLTEEDKNNNEQVLNNQNTPQAPDVLILGEETSTAVNDVINKAKPASGYFSAYAGMLPNAYGQKVGPDGISYSMGINIPKEKISEGHINVVSLETPENLTKVLNLGGNVSLLPSNENVDAKIGVELFFSGEKVKEIITAQTNNLKAGVSISDREFFTKIGGEILKNEEDNITSSLNISLSQLLDLQKQIGTSVFNLVFSTGVKLDGLHVILGMDGGVIMKTYPNGSGDFSGTFGMNSVIKF